MFVDDFVLSRAEQVSSNGLFRPTEAPFFPLSSPVDISRVLFVSFVQLKSCRVKNMDIVRIFVSKPIVAKLADACSLISCRSRYKNMLGIIVDVNWWKSFSSICIPDLSFSSFFR